MNIYLSVTFYHRTLFIFTKNKMYKCAIFVIKHRLKSLFRFDMPDYFEQLSELKKYGKLLERPLSCSGFD